MKLISWNVNGLRACLKKGFAEAFAGLDADAFCIQETKMQPGQADFAPEGYTEYIYSAEKKGYSGTAVWTKAQPLSVNYGIGVEEHSHEGRAITLEYPGFYLVNVYVPNAQEGLARIDYRMRWEDDLRAYLLGLDAKKPVVLCGDMNVAHNEIDLKNPGPNRGAAGFSDQERGKMTELLAAGFKLTPNDSVPGEQDWVYYVRHGEDTLAVDDQVPTGATLTLIIGNGEPIPVPTDSLATDSLGLMRDSIVTDLPEDESWF